MTQCTKCQQQDGANNGHCDCRDPICGCCKTSVAELLNKNTEKQFSNSQNFYAELTNDSVTDGYLEGLDTVLVNGRAFISEQRVREAIEKRLKQSSSEYESFEMAKDEEGMYAHAKVMRILREILKESGL